MTQAVIDCDVTVFTHNLQFIITVEVIFENDQQDATV